MFGREAKDGEAFRDIGFKPVGELRSSGAVLGCRSLEQGFGLGPGGSVEHLAQIGGEDAAQGDLGRVLQSVLLKMKLTALPGDGGNLTRISPVDVRNLQQYLADPFARSRLQITISRSGVVEDIQCNG